MRSLPPPCFVAKANPFPSGRQAAAMAVGFVSSRRTLTIRPPARRGEPSMGIVQRRLVKGVLWIVARPKLTLAAAAAVLAVAAIYAHQRLTVSTDQNDLFSPKV